MFPYDDVIMLQWNASLGLFDETYYPSSYTLQPSTVNIWLMVYVLVGMCLCVCISSVSFYKHIFKPLRLGELLAQT